MRLKLTPLQARIMAGMLLLLLLAAIGTAIFLTKQRWTQHYDEVIANALDHLTRYQRIIAMRKDLESALAAVKAKDARRFYLKNSGPALAAAEVQQRAQGIIDANGLKVDSTQIPPPVDEDGHRKITVNLRLRGKLPDLQKMLYALETKLPWLYVNNLTLRTSVGPVFRAIPGLEPDIYAQFDLYGYALIPQPKGLLKQGIAK